MAQVAEAAGLAAPELAVEVSFAGAHAAAATASTPNASNREVRRIPASTNKIFHEIRVIDGKDTSVSWYPALPRGISRDLTSRVPRSDVSVDTKRPPPATGKGPS
ncbi:hypothetical protein Pmi06nite_21740 [Planotetraspora mira]|uniref:Uncharacterized protein n=1 Tax=Planotetraspora mira TaxID=58121 RepID=A0A8J3X5G9_9ACTN|nr:hypothetical protein Pmi06nite_21740 [Planotetraspora mira]